MKIGFCTRNITPQGVVSLGGGSGEKLADQVRDPLQVTAMVLDGGNDGALAVLVSCDIVSITAPIRDGVYEGIMKAVPDLNPDLITLFATHTHNAPFIVNPYWTRLGVDYASVDGVVTVVEFTELIVTRIVEAIQAAWQNRAEGYIHAGQGSAVLGHNRRVIFDDGKAVMFGNVNSPHFVRLGGPEDHRVELLFAWNRERKLQGILINLACTSQYFSYNAITADLFGEVRKQVAEKWGADVHVLGMIGAAGDLHPRDVFDRNYRKDTQDEICRKAVERLLQTVEQALQTAANELEESPVVLKHHVFDISLPRRTVNKSQVEEAEKRWATHQQWLEQQPDRKTAFQLFMKMGFYEKFGLLNHLAIIERAQLQQTDPFFRMKLHAIRIGHIAIVTNPFELFAEYGLQIKARSAARQTFIAELADDRGGYLPTADAIETGGYSTELFSNPVGPEGGKLLVEYTLQAIDSLWTEA